MNSEEFILMDFAKFRAYIDYGELILCFAYNAEKNH